MALRSRQSPRLTRNRDKRLAIETLEARLALAANPIINEILASNDGLLQDVDGEYSDFIEIYNAGDAAIDLAGWHLTDNAGNLSKWTFPSVALDAGEFLVVFASNKNRAIAGSELHTNFALSAGGEFLALVQPNGVTIASALSPAFPPQFENISYGRSSQGDETVVIGPQANVLALAPTNGALGTAWTQPGFAPGAGWVNGTTGVGYSAFPPAPVSTTVLEVDFNARGNPSNTHPGFSSFTINGSGIQTGSVSRTYGSVSVTLSDASGLGFDDRSRSTPVNSGAFTDAKLLQDFVFSRANAGTGGLDVVIGGLIPAQIYTLSVWSYDSGSPGARVSDWSANGAAIEDYSFAGGTSPVSNDHYRFGLVVVADSFGKVTLRGRNDEESSDLSVFLNALRLETGDTLSSAANGQSLRVDFNDRTEGESGSANTEAGYSTMTLDANGAIINGAKITFSAFGGATLDDRDRAAPTASGAFTLDQVYDDFIFASGPAGGGLEMLIQGLVPNARYDLVLRSLDGTSTGVRQSNWTEMSSGFAVPIASPYSYNAANLPTSNDANAMRASLLTSPQGTLLLRGVQLGANTSVVVNGLELTRANFDEEIGLDIEPTMRYVASSAYLRVPFAVSNIANIAQLLLDLRYDAGFVAYLNGQEVLRRNAPTLPGAPPAHNAVATIERSNSEALTPETFDLTPFRHLLVEGTGNVLAIHGLNSSPGDEDFLISPQLRTIGVAEQTLRFFQTPSPGAFNGAGVVDFAAAAPPSVPHGFYDSPFSVELVSPTPGAQVYYTFDGSIPSPENASAFLYTSPITIGATTTLRSVAVKPAYGNSSVSTATYIFLEGVLTQDPLQNVIGPQYPALWQGNASGDYAVDPEIVSQWDDDNPANSDFGIREALKSIPTMSIVMDHDDLWNAATGIYPNATSEGDAWRRAGSIEFIDPSSGAEFQHNVGVQMHGAASRDNNRLKKHSFRLIFSGEFDGPGRLNFPLFDNSDCADINTVVLKAAFTDSFATRTVTDRYSPLDSTYTRDAFMLDSQRAMGSLAPDVTYVHLYINGLYWGLYYPSERVDDAYLASHVGGAEEDWDVIKDFNELFRGNADAWNAMFALSSQISSAGPAGADAIYQQLQGKNANGTINAASPVYLDMDNLIDYMILHLYAGVEDWPSHNWVAARNRVDPGAGFQFFTWDQEVSLDGRFRDRTEVNNAFTPAQLYANLRYSAEFRLRFADRVQKHLFNDGALTNAASQARWQDRADQIEAAIIGESARWGDARASEVVNVPPQTVIPVMTVDHWRDSIADVRDDILPQSHSLAVSRFQADGLFPTIGAPIFNQFGGEVDAGFTLSMTTVSGGATIYYTLNGDDPRATGGGVAVGAAVATAAGVQLNGTTTVKARTRVGSTWSALTEATFSMSHETGGIVISEINYHPHAPTAAESAALPGVQEDDFEFIEILNTHPTIAMNLNGMTLANGLTFSFGNVSLAPGQRAVIVENLAAFQARYGAGHNVLGAWSGGASNSGETIELRNALGEIVMAVAYADVNPWSEAADGDGATLELINPYGTPPDRLGKWYSWRASSEFGGTPDAAGVGPMGVVINEVMTHSSAPYSDSIELHNTTNQPINVGGWYLSDAGGTPRKFQIPLGTVIAAGGYAVFNEEDFNPTSPVPGQIPFALKAAESDDVFLTIPNGSGGVNFIVDSVHFGAAFGNESFGRLPNGAGRLAPMLQPTLGAANSQPRVGELIISEVGYQPSAPSAAALALDPSITSAHLEFIEIYNRGAVTRMLTNSSIAGGVSFNFAAGASLAAGGTAVIVSFNPATPANATRLAAFRAHYGIDASVTIIGPFSGSLHDGGAVLELQIPDEPPSETPLLFPKVLSDEVLYDNLAEWPIIGMGSGYSIHRTAAQMHGSVGANWQANTPSPGFVAYPMLSTADFNSDGRVDGSDFLVWQRGFASTNAVREHGSADGDLDVDGQDLSIWKQEFGAIAGLGVASEVNSPATGLDSVYLAVNPMAMIVAEEVAPSYAAHHHRRQTVGASSLAELAGLFTIEEPSSRTAVGAGRGSLTSKLNSTYWQNFPRASNLNPPSTSRVAKGLRFDEAILRRQGSLHHDAQLASETDGSWIRAFDTALEQFE